MTRLLLIAVLLALLPLNIATTTANAQSERYPYDLLPDCGFTQAANRDDIIVGAVLLNFQTGAGCAENLDVTFQTASVPKLFVANAYYERIAQGIGSFNTPMQFTQNYLMGGRSACLGADEVGNTYTSRELLEVMIYCSDNAATWMLMDLVGWGRVQQYIDALAIPGLGPMLPYSYVDRQKLAYLDPRWENVPPGLAARYYRRRWTDGLVPTYFSNPDAIPGLRRGDFIRINTAYLQDSQSNTATPRAMAEYLLKLREDYYAPDARSWVARQMFGAMMLTQRLNAMQAMPGAVYIGAKNGFDTGVVAEVNLLIGDIETREPQGIALLFVQQDVANAYDIQTPSFSRGPLNELLRALSPQITRTLYPNYVQPEIATTSQLSHVLLQARDEIDPCWIPYRLADFEPGAVDTLENCLRRQQTQRNFEVGQDVGMGVVVRNLDRQDTRFVFVYTAPDGRVFSYQTDRELQDKAGIYWFHPLDMAGQWQIDIYLNLRHVYSSTINAT